MGAADVVPFIPIEGVTLEDCVQSRGMSARRSGSDTRFPSISMKRLRPRPSGRIWRTYAAASSRAFARTSKTNPARKPDFGEPQVHPTAGATVVGARKLLIAYNVFLNTTDVDIAKKIAKAVRFSYGGLRL